MAKKAEMMLDLSFGSVPADRLESGKSARFRIALMGDFSGRAAKGEVEIGADLAKRRPIKLDVDTLEKVIKGFGTTLVLPIGKKGQGIEVELGSIDDLHPDELFEKVMPVLVSIGIAAAGAGVSFSEAANVISYYNTAQGLFNDLANEGRQKLEEMLS